MAVIDNGAGYEIHDLCLNLQAEIKAWNAETVLNGGAEGAFGSTGQRIYEMPQGTSKVGRDQPIIYVMSGGMSGNIYGAREVPEGSGGRFLYDATLKATVVILARMTRRYGYKTLRNWAALLRMWLEEHGANGYCQAFAAGDTTPVSIESAKEPTGIRGWQIPVAGIREVVRDVDFS